MNVTVIQAYNLPSKDQGGSTSYRLRLLLYPTKRQRAKTRIREGSNPEFKELFRFTRLYPHELVGITLRLRLYGTERMRRERLIGEGQVKFSSLNTATQQMVRVKLESKSEISVSHQIFPRQIYFNTTILCIFLQTIPPSKHKNLKIWCTKRYVHTIILFFLFLLFKLQVQLVKFDFVNRK